MSKPTSLDATWWRKEKAKTLGETGVGKALDGYKKSSQRLLKEINFLKSHLNDQQAIRELDCDSRKFTDDVYADYKKSAVKLKQAIEKGLKMTKNTLYKETEAGLKEYQKLLASECDLYENEKKAIVKKMDDELKRRGFGLDIP